MASGEEIRGGGKIGAEVAATRLGDGWTQTAGLVTAPEPGPLAKCGGWAGRKKWAGIRSVQIRPWWDGCSLSSFARGGSRWYLKMFFTNPQLLPIGMVHGT